jgi:selenocysteine lyase/cysteine desulfurase
MAETTATRIDLWQRFRDQMPVTRKWAYLDHAAVAPLPSSTCAAVGEWLEEAASEGDVVWSRWTARQECIRQTAAALMGADSCEIAFVSNTTAGISLIAEALPWRSGDNVVTLADEFPSNLYPWMNLAARGVETRRVAVEHGQPDLERLDAACDGRTRVLTVSWVGYATGWRMDVAAVADIARRHGAHFCLDAIQGLGVFPLDVHSCGVDFLAADGHKWLLGPEGAGLVYIRRDLLGELRPLGVGWNSVVRRGDYAHVELNLRPEAARYEGGSANLLGIHALGASLDLLGNFAAADPDRSVIGERVIELTDLACAGLQQLGASLVTVRREGHKSGIVTFHLPGHDPAAVRRACQQAGVVLSCRGGGVRISPHAYNNEADIEQFLGALGQLQGTSL